MGEKGLFNIYKEIKRKLKEGKESVGIYEKRQGGETVFVYNIFKNDIFTVSDFNLLNKPLVGNPKF